MAESLFFTNANLRVIYNTCDRPDVALQCISGYEKLEPVPLEQAAESIQSIFNDLARAVFVAKAATKKPEDNLTPDESAAIYLYTLDIKPRSFYIALNEALCHRDRRKLNPWLPYLKLLLSGLFKIPPYKAKIAWHGVKADLQQKYEINQHYTWWALTSCVPSVDILNDRSYLGNNGVRTVFSMECLTARSIRAHSSNQREEEILILPGTYFEVLSNLHTGHGLHIIRLREAQPPYVLLEPPFATVNTEADMTGMDHVLEKIYTLNKDNGETPKLFIILPDPNSPWSMQDVWNNKFIIHLVCECAVNNLHFALHPGYALPSAKIFFQIYGLYLKEYMIPLGQYLLKIRLVNSVQDAHFWSTFQIDLNRMSTILNQVESNPLTIMHTTKLKDTIAPSWIRIGNLNRSLKSDMTIRWVCRRHYPVDQLQSIRRLRECDGISFDEQESEMTISGELNPTQLRRLSSTVLRGLRIYTLNYVYHSPVLDQLNKVFCRALITNICHNGELCEINDKGNMERLLKLCNQVVAANAFVQEAKLSDGGGVSRKRVGIRDALKSHNTLRSLTFTGSMTNQGISEVVASLKSNTLLTTLELRDRPLPPRGAEELADLIKTSSTLVNLVLSNTMLKDDGFHTLANGICANPIMQRLEVSLNRIHDKSSAQIINVMKACVNLRSLDLHCNEFSAIGARRIFEKLKSNRTLLCFNIGLNNLAVRSGKQASTSKNPLANGGEWIGTMLTENTTLIDLNMSHVNMSEFGIQGFGEGLENNQTLTHLNLTSNKIFDADRPAVLDAMRINNTLLSLDVSHNDMEDSSAIKLGEMLRINKRLRYLRAQSCLIEDSRMYNLARALQDQLSLTHLDLAKNKIGDDGAMVIADILSKNKTLMYLNVSENRITDQGIQAISTSLESNITLLYLDILVQQDNITVFAIVKFRSVRPDLVVK